MEYVFKGSIYSIADSLYMYLHHDPDGISYFDRMFGYSNDNDLFLYIAFGGYGFLSWIQWND